MASDGMSDVSRNNGQFNENHRLESPESADDSPEITLDTESNRTSVNFDFNGAEKDAEKKKFFTGKYDDRQRKKIKHRMKVENWLWEQLLLLYDCEDDDEHNCEIDIDDLSDFNSDDERRQCLRDLLKDAKQTKEQVDEFIENLIRYARPFWDDAK